MCGIIAFRDREVLDKDITIQAMMKMIQHRGPNELGSGYYANDELAMGFRRLSVIDLKSGKQPIFNEDGSVLITFNGEIYNFQPLRQQLIDAGHVFKSEADTEVLLHGYEQWGMDGLLKRIRGMFTFLIWDDNKKTLLGARDYFGIKPLYYYQQGSAFIVGSEIKAFFKEPNFKPELNRQAVKPFLMNQYNDLKETFFKGVRRFPPGHWFELKGDDFQVHQYWDASYDVDYGRSQQETIDAIDRTVQESVDLHTVADVPVGAFLSEGVDSSYVTSLLRPQEVFSVNFDEGPFDEVGPAQALADHEGLHFNKATVSADEAFRDFEQMQYHLDEPDANPSVIPLWYLCRLARQKVTVVLSGEGADELFAGYLNYGDHSSNAFIRALADGLGSLPTGLKRRIGHLLAKMPNFPGRVQLYTHTADPAEYYAGQAFAYDLAQPTMFTSEQANAILQPEYRNDLTVNGIYQEDFAKVKGAEDVKRMQYIDLHHFMLNDILQKADKISMAHSLELRVPYLDRQVAELANSIPSKMLFNRHNTKDIFRKAARRHLPDEWAKRPKLGFPVPIKSWLREEKYYRQVRNLFEQEWVTDIFDQERILRLLDDNYAGRIDGRRQVWNIYTLLTWYRLFFVDFDRTVERYNHLQPEVQALVEQGSLR
ncbi:asparagine synthase (glutamine-hydrolyzing) [Bifidobacterium actinocoloniiforme DSM 22766]|uniref:asparagine synthase (glutamine-hydrolyzing) n=1 Tax=Bifidobacterium actinocoloniiforme DSM 22766 TaxID=1437605 RepID=A0A086YWD9_9BIFI|nr:asparagine synthase (glutamine-hydrolyzing) [Bifidobacterium actinocoloniiforme]AKV55789.1 asparagine synthase [Bifidobacterium actinocoloniiforme DSM 22766]KFI38589.1 asparagine synthase (glutamine-hydrolyzing) [Bifidobacterium actinocoloniiforme DSM 22766]